MGDDVNPAAVLLIAGLITLAFMSGVGAFRLVRARRRYLSAEQVRRRVGWDADEYDITGI